MRQKIILILVLIVAFAADIRAQEARVISFRQTADPMMKSMERKDLNGVNCALVKVILPLQGAVFEGNTVGDVAFRTNEYWVYLIDGTKLLRIKVPGVMPLMVSFPELTYSDAPHGLQSDCIYELAVGLPEYLYELAARQAMASMPEVPASTPAPSSSGNADSGGGILARIKRDGWRKVAAELEAEQAAREAVSGRESEQKVSRSPVVTGQVLDTRMEPVIGAYVTEVYSGRTIVTDIDGNFRGLFMPGKTLQFKYIGADEVSMPAYDGMTVIMGGKEPHQLLTEPEAVDMGLSVDWADRNIGALRATDYGGLYYWGSVGGLKPTGHKFAAGESISGNRKYDFAAANLGSGWRMPTEAEIRELTEKCTMEYAVVDSVGGYRFIGPNGNSIFVPLVPGIDVMLIQGNPDYRVAFWTGSVAGHDSSKALVFWPSLPGENVRTEFLSEVDIKNPRWVFPVRPVKVKQPADDGAEYFNLKGEKLPGRPTQPGVYIERKNGKSRKLQI